ncbi:fatty acid desaturase [Acinetobacter sp. 2JN-4]|uniref:Fatty acid desaturase n=1 Tax=Acinetobacter halotolerans TaxID=1752076 RepID=A0A4Q6XHF6_9GAMM|nr:MULTISPECIES: fatty acid desaturase [Acinetobacter]RLZ08802.1 fatty acid desaturase [Acinetobacter sp. 2JN-4]RZF53609.1 fatty acid desaturase [Acinetobacter halotolerans]
MSYTYQDPSGWTDAEKTEYIKKVVNAEGVALRKKYSILKHQNAIGALILAFSLAGMGVTAYFYIVHQLSVWWTIPLIAFFASLTHELEHDLIHWMYFRKKPWAHHLMMGLVWLARPSTINPWARRELHFNHHKMSGTEHDIEERALGNGDVWGIRRFFATGDNGLAVLFRVISANNWTVRKMILKRSFKAYFPLGIIHWSLWYVFLGYHAVNLVAMLADTSILWSATTLQVMHVVNILTVVWIAPNVLRTFCLHFVTSNMHYYGDVELGNVIQQTQVLKPWWMMPFQLFCFNFGSTHAIHHFVVKEPFYLRQMTAPVAHKVMRDMGVRFNDLGTFKRANRWETKVLSEQS